MSSIRGIIQSPSDQLRLQELASRQYQAHRDEIRFFTNHNKTKPTIHPECFNLENFKNYPIFSPVSGPVKLPPTPTLSPSVLSTLSPCNVQHAPPLDLATSPTSALQPIPLLRQKSTISRLSKTLPHGPSAGLF
jgi:hypothetical protein